MFEVHRMQISQKECLDTVKVKGNLISYSLPKLRFYGRQDLTLTHKLTGLCGLFEDVTSHIND